MPKKLSSKYCARFGRIAVEMRFISEAQLSDAVRIQIAEAVSDDELRLLATVLFDLSWMTSEQTEQVLNALAKRSQQDDAD